MKRKEAKAVVQSVSEQGESTLSILEAMSMIRIASDDGETYGIQKDNKVFLAQILREDNNKPPTVKTKIVVLD